MLRARQAAAMRLTGSPAVKGRGISARMRAAVSTGHAHRTAAAMACWISRRIRFPFEPVTRPTRSEALHAQAAVDDNSRRFISGD